MSLPLQLGLVGALYLILVLTAQHVNEHVPHAYMDEIFHVPQAQLFCAGRFDEWNSKITTLPGLYLLAPLLSWAAGPQMCQVGTLRAVNAVYALLLALVLLLIEDDRTHRRRQAGRSALAVIGDVLCPTIAFYHFLFYTDTGGLLFLALTYWLAVSRRRMAWAALAGAAAVLFRQTNVVWVGLVAALCVLDDHGASATLTSFAAFVVRNVPLVARRCWPFLVLAAAFGAFVLLNGSIVVGDKENHKASLHFAQLAYVAVFVYAHIAVSSFRWTHLLELRTRWLSTLLLSVALGLLVYRFSEPHAFLLADNRHYTFYIWRRVLDRHGALGRALVLGPLASISVHLLQAALRDAGRGSAFLTLLALATAAALVPSPLLEPRYFSAPLLFTRIHMRQAVAPWRVAVESGLFAVVTAVQLAVFVHYPLGGNKEDRLMW
jgi:alpha-1,2-glucosyltransferase